MGNSPIRWWFLLSVILGGLCVSCGTDGKNLGDDVLLDAGLDGMLQDGATDLSGDFIDDAHKDSGILDLLPEDADLAGWELASDTVDAVAPDLSPDLFDAAEELAEIVPDVWPDLIEVDGWVEEAFDVVEIEEEVVPEIVEDIVEPPPPVWDLDMIRNTATANCAFANQHVAMEGTTVLTVWEMSYTSWESIDGQLIPITIRGFAAKPSISFSDRPAVILAHGLGGYATQDSATSLAAKYGAFVVAYTGPGGGSEANNTSQGRPSGYDNGYRMFDVMTDTRGSWFWGHTVAAMRAITCLQTRDDIDMGRVGMTGYSAGAVATLLAAGVDDRIKAAVPLSGTLDWDTAVKSPKAWQNNLLALAGLTKDSPEWVKLIDELIDAPVALGTTSVPILMVNGSTDEFFPLTAHKETYAAIPGTSKRTSISANHDHGCYSLTGMESAGTIEDRASFHANGAQDLWFGHYFDLDSKWDHIPAAPMAEATPAGQLTMITAIVDEGGSELNVVNVKAWFSTDSGFFYGSADLNLVEDSDSMYFLLAPFTMQPNTILYVDVTYEESGWFGSEVFALSSPPVYLSSFVPHIRDMDTCL